MLRLMASALIFARKLASYMWECLLGLLLGVLLIKNFLLLFLFIIKNRAYLFHIDDSVDLAGGKFAQAIFTAGTHPLLVHMHQLPVLGQVLLLHLLQKSRFMILKSTCIDFNTIHRNLVLEKDRICLHPTFIFNIIALYRFRFL